MYYLDRINWGASFLLRYLEIEQFQPQIHYDLWPTINQFFDIRVFINPDGSIGSSLFRKPSAGNTNLHAASSHPMTLLWSILYSQYLRLKRDCSQQEEFEIEAKALQIYLINRGYSGSSLKKSYHWAKSNDIDTLIHTKKPKPQDQKVRLITCYSEQHRQVHHIIQKRLIFTGDGWCGF